MSPNSSEPDGRRSGDSAPLRPERRTFWLRMAGVLVVVLLVLNQGERIAQWLPQLEQQADRLGAVGPMGLSAAILIGVPLLVPDSIFGITAGVAFGLIEGTLCYFGATYLANLLIYAASRRWLRGRVLSRVERRPRLDAVLRAARSQSLRLIFLLRLMPLNTAIVSYALGAGGIRFRPFAIGTLGLFPHMFLTVYLGYSAKRLTALSASQQSGWHVEQIALVAGLGAFALLLIQVTRIARSALARIDETNPPSPEP